MTLVIRKLTASTILLLMCMLILPCLASAQHRAKKREPAAPAAPGTATDVPTGPMTLWQARKDLPDGRLVTSLLRGSVSLCCFRAHRALFHESLRGLWGR